MTFEWSQVYRLIYTNGSKPREGIDFWMGDSRGRWEGDTLVVDVTNHNDKTWFDMAGNFHSEAMQLVERYTMLDADTIQYEVTIEDPKVFTRPWKISMPLYRQKDMDSRPRISVPGGGGRSQRGVRARSADLVSEVNVTHFEAEMQMNKHLGVLARGALVRPGDRDPRAGRRPWSWPSAGPARRQRRPRRRRDRFAARRTANPI